MTALGWCTIANFPLAQQGPSRHDVSFIFTTAATGATVVQGPSTTSKLHSGSMFDAD